MHLLGCTLLLLLGAVAIAQPSYSLDCNFSGTTFFDNFNFWTAGDPTYGFVHYVDQATAEAYGMINVAEHPAEWRADATQVLDPDSALGRLSIRLTSIQSWTHGLFILDLVHMPPNQCGVWPAFWTLGSGTWPYNGEIDIIEYVGVESDNVMTLHTLGGPACTVAGSGQSGILGPSNNCSAGGGYTGCSVTATLPDTVGSGFDETGGVYAMQWTSEGIQIWYFPRPQIPSSITLGQPDPSTFGLPMANFAGDCDFDAHFFNHSIIFDTTFCGTYAGPEWEPQGCLMAEDTSNSWTSCNDFVANNPEAFNDTYWQVNYLAVYTTPPAAPFPPSTSLSSVPVAPSTTLPPGALGQSATPTMSFPVTSSPTTTNTLPKRDDGTVPWACPIQSDCIPLGGSVEHPSASTSAFPSDGVCNFYIPGHPCSQAVSTTYTCTFTGLGNVNGRPEPFTEWVTIPVASDKPVDLVNVFIQSVHVEMIDYQDFESHPFTGVFTPTATSIHETTLTAYAVLPQRDRRGEIPNRCQMWALEPLPAPLSGPDCNDSPARAGELPSLPSATVGWKKRQPDAQVEDGGEIGFCSVPGAACQEHRRGEVEQSIEKDDTDANPLIDTGIANIKQDELSSPVSGGSIGFCGVPGEGGMGCRVRPTELAKNDQGVDGHADALKRTAQPQTESGGIIGWQGVPGGSIDEKIVAVAKTDIALATVEASTEVSAPARTDRIRGEAPRLPSSESSAAPAGHIDRTGVDGPREECSTAYRAAAAEADSTAIHAPAAMPQAGLGVSGGPQLNIPADVTLVEGNGIVLDPDWKQDTNDKANDDGATFPVAQEAVQRSVQARTAIPQAMLAVPGGPQLDVPSFAPTFVPFVPWGNGMELEPSGWKRESYPGLNGYKSNSAMNAAPHEDHTHVSDAAVTTYTPTSFCRCSSKTFHYSATRFPSHSSRTFTYNPNFNRQADTLETTPVEILSDVVKGPADGLEPTKFIQSATCTPVVYIGADGKPSPGGCMAPQNVFLTLSEHIVVANATKTITQTAANPSNTPYLTNGQLMRVDSMQEKAHENAAASAAAKTYLTATLITIAAALLAFWGRFL